MARCPNCNNNPKGFSSSHMWIKKTAGKSFATGVNVEDSLVQAAVHPMLISIIESAMETKFQ